jgi:hypothetical protein
MPTPISLTPGMGSAIAEAVCIPLWSSLRAGRRRQAHGLAGIEEAPRPGQRVHCHGQRYSRTAL